MKYLEWNNLIAKHFFNPEQAGKEIHLFITKQEIINLAKENLEGKTNGEIWFDFLRKLKGGLPGSSSHPYLIDKAIHSYTEWKRPGIKSIEGVELKFPPYVAYLVFLVLPLVEIQGNYNANNYYDRLEDFLNENLIKQNLRNRLSEIEILWNNLAHWANTTNNGEQGFFRLRNFIHQNWIYVGKVFSQSIFPPRAIKKLPELFLQAGMIPDSNYPLTEFKKNLLKYGSSILLLPKSVLDIIQRSDTHELGQSIVETAKKEYNKWTGESHSIDETGIRTKRNDISSRIYLQLQLFSNEGRIQFSYRMKSANEFPEDLNFNGSNILEEKGGYSKTINLPFKSSFELKDNFNKWVAKFPDKDFRLFISAGSLQLSTDYWIETDTLTKVNWMLLLCRKSKQDRIVNWLKNDCSGYEDESDFENMPDGYSLFKFLNPQVGIDEIPELTIIREKDIKLVSALEVDFRTFTNDFLPEVEVLNSIGTERVYLQYKNSEEKIFLKKTISNSNHWSLPADIVMYVDFNVRAEGETFLGNETAYKIISANDSATILSKSRLPKRDSFGKITENNLSKYSIGSSIFGANILREVPYQHLFRGTKEDSTTELIPPVYINSKGNMLLSFLTLKGTATVQEFYVAFEFLYSKFFENKNESEELNYSKIKKASLNFFNYLGYLDYEYETKLLVVSPPQMIFIPTSEGRKVLLIGGRDASLVNSIIEVSNKYNLQVEITKQFNSNEDLLLPDAITIKSFGNSKERFGELNLIAFAKELKIEFNPAELVQVGLQDFCSDIEEYENDMLAKKETIMTFEDWAKYTFNAQSLQLNKAFTETFDKHLTFLEYRLRPWEFYHRLWLNQKCYDVDRNWGKYLILKKLNIHVVLKGNMKVAIPVGLPLPRLLFEAIMLCSGVAPELTYINGRSYRIYENIPSMFINNLFQKLGQKPLNFELL